MTPDRAILERNLGLLLRRAYVPVVAREEFRRALERDVLAAAERASRARRGRSKGESWRDRPWRDRPWLAIATAASLAIVAFLAFRALRESSAPASADAILARGEVAWRTARDGPWSSARAGGPAIAFEAPFVELLTPAGARAALDVGELEAGAEAWGVGPAAHVEVESSRGEVVATLRRGALEASLGASAPRASIATSEGTLPLAGSSLRVAFEPPERRELWTAPTRDTGRWVRVSVLDGELALAGAPRLGRGGELYLVGGEALLPLDPASGAGGGRIEVAVTAAPDGPTTPGPRDPAAALDVLAGTVTAGGEPLDEFTVVTLREVLLPQVAEPEEHGFRGARGRFAISGLERGRYRVFVRAPGHAVGRRERVDVDPAAGAPVLLEVELERGATLRGSIVDQATGLPVPDAYVVSETDAQLYVLSLDAAENGAFAPSAGVRADGGFELANASSGSQLLRASAPGYGPAWKALDDVGDGESRLGIVIALAREGRVAGSVLRADGTPVAGSLLLATTTDFESKRPCLTYASTLTDGEGRYEIGGLSPGGWAVLEFGPTAGLVRGRYAPEMAFTRIRTGETARVDFHEKRPVKVLRGVLLGAGGEPVSGRTVMVAPLERALPPPEGGWTSATTGSDGSYRIPDLEPGPHEMFVSGRLPPEMTRVGRFEVGAGPETVHDVRLPGGSIAGRVLDGERGEPLDLAVLVLYRRDGDANEFVAKAFSDAQGRYEIPYLADGRYELYAHASREPYGQERRVDLVVEGGAALEDVELTLRLGGTLAIVARDASGAPLAQAAIELVDASGDPVEFSGDQRTDEAGRFAVSGIRPGAWRVRALSGGRIVAERAVEIAPGARSEIELVAAPR